MEDEGEGKNTGSILKIIASSDLYLEDSHIGNSQVLASSTSSTKEHGYQNFIVCGILKATLIYSYCVQTIVFIS